METNAQTKPDFSHRHSDWYIDDINQIARDTEAIIVVFSDQFVDTDKRPTYGLNDETNYFALQSIAKNLKDIQCLCEAQMSSDRAKANGEVNATTE